MYRNFIINDLIKNKKQLFGWDTALQFLKSEYDLDLTNGDTALYTKTFVTEYNERAFQSRFTELYMQQKQTESNISSDEGEAWYAVTGLFQC